MKYLKNYKVFENINPEVIWYHGTDTVFTEFKEPDDKNRNVSKLGIWFTNDEGFAESFGGVIIKAKLTYNNPRIITLENWNEIRSHYYDDSIYFSDLRKKLMSKGYDAWYVKGEDDTLGGYKVTTPDVVAVFHKSQIEIIKQ